MDRSRTSVAELDPESRALLELSLLRGLSDEELAGVLGTDAESIRRRREALLEDMGAYGERGRERLAASLRGEPEEGPVDEPAAVADERSPTVDDDPAEAETPPPSPIGADIPAAEVPGDEPSPSRAPRRPIWALAGGLTIAALVALVLALSANEDTDAGSPGPDESQPPGDVVDGGGEPAPDQPPADLEQLSPVAGEGEATAEIVVGGPRPTLRLSVNGLPGYDEGGYVVWLYNSVSDALELTGSRRGTFTVEPELPREAAEYGFIDISREPSDGNQNHSGASVLRVAIEDVPRVSE